MYKFLFISMLSIVIHANELPEYEARYKFDSKEISITGIRELKRINDEYEMQFKASNLFASMFFLSKFEINGDQLIPKTYDIKIRPKFLKRDQFINFNKEKNIIESTGETVWSSDFVRLDEVFDPLNAQIVIRILMKKGFEEFEFNILDIKNGDYKKYNFRVLNKEKCIVNNEQYNCLVLERYRNESNRTVKYYLAEELDFMFVKIIDKNPDRTNTLELLEILSFG